MRIPDWLNDLGLGRKLSIVLAVVYLFFMFFVGGIESALKFSAFLLIALACIWFPNELGAWTGVMPLITRKTPGVFIRMMGWVLLLLPILIGLVSGLSELFK